MKKLFCLLAALAVVTHVSAYELEIENDTDATTFEVSMRFFKDQFPRQMFQLAPEQERVFNVPNGVPIQGGIKVRKIVGGKPQGRTAVYRPRKVADKTDIEIKLDDAGRIYFEEELF